MKNKSGHHDKRIKNKNTFHPSSRGILCFYGIIKFDNGQEEGALEIGNLGKAENLYIFTQEVDSQGSRL